MTEPATKPAERARSHRKKEKKPEPTKRLACVNVTEEDWLKTGEQLFGPNRKLWRFRCVSCGHVQSYASIIEHTPSVEPREVQPYFSCEGRISKDQGCDWTLGGLFTIQKVAVFRAKSQSFTPVFLFDHPEAYALLKALEMPPRPAWTTDAKSWSEWTWPIWVPMTVQKEVESFWSCFGRNPQEYVKSATLNDAPPLGAKVTLQRGGGEGSVTGRFVFAQNNIGRIVQDDGTVAFVSF